MQSQTMTQNMDGDTTMKVARSVHQELREESQKYGFATFAQYTEYLLQNRNKIMETNTQHQPQNGGVMPDSPPWQETKSQPPKGTYISDEELSYVKSYYQNHQKDQAIRDQQARTIQALQRVIEQLIEEAANCSGRFFDKYDSNYFERKTLGFLQKEGVPL